MGSPPHPPSLLEEIRSGRASGELKQQAARGALGLPAEQQLEILVLLAQDSDPSCRDTARQTLAGWPAEKITELLARPDISLDVVAYFAVQEKTSPEELAAALAREEEAEAQAKPEEKRQRVSLTQKIAALNVSERVQLALKGSKDERLILIRDPSKVVYRAVVQSPKVSDSEVEAFASMKNVADEALRLIANNRQYIKSYVVVRNLANNPRTPLDVSLTLLNRLNNQDLKFLGLNRNVPETLRTMATKLFKQRTETRRGPSH